MNIRVILSYLNKKSDPSYEYGLERERWKPNLVKMSPWEPYGFPKSPPKSLDKFHDEHSVTYSKGTLESLEHYGGDGHALINRHLRGIPLGYDEDGESYDESGDDIEEHIDSIDEGMEKSPLKSNVTVWRGLGSLKSGDHKHPIEERLHELGALEGHEINYKKALDLKGFTFVDPGFVSTTMNPKISHKFMDIYGYYLQLEIKVPAGTQAIYLPGAHKVRNLYNKGWISERIDLSTFHNETELLLDRGLKFKVTNVDVSSIINNKDYSGIKVTVEVVK